MKPIGPTEFFREYRKRSKKPVDQKIFRKVLRTYNEMLVDSVVEGATMPFGHNLSTLQIFRIPTSPTNPQINWKESLQYKKQLLEQGKKLWDGVEGEKWFIYFDQKWFVRFFWDVKGPGSRVKNKSYYSFIPARGLESPKQKLKKALAADDMAYLKYRKYDGHL